ncbi:FliH/SctL family protein [Paenibacillus sp. GP183]|uniref:FliH/SctL family protein n=1 Tax=Paenibacillus sp. GP183 TaxID=1882751 RepID=UPI000AE09F8F|nr:FliH/SctL family protein [Paenibacillus sp. GP183]
MSNVIKPFGYVALDDKKLVESITPLHILQGGLMNQDDPLGHLTQEQRQELHHAKAMKDQILQDAEEYANEQIQKTLQECEIMREQANAQIDQWWQERRSLDEEIVQQAKQSGFDEGYQAGLQQVEAQLRLDYEEMLHEARSILEQSYTLKQQIIQESEPFLIEMSTSIAEKVITRQLTMSPEWVIELIQKVLARRREKGTITLCVAPGHFGYLQDAREELLTAIDSQAELEIIPDSTVLDHGCVIRSSFGSVDARIDTQLKEIKSALQQIAINHEGETS